MLSHHFIVRNSIDLQSYEKSHCTMYCVNLYHIVLYIVLIFIIL
jgi:hypothetical protein